MTRRCSHCSNNGHNSRTCPTKGGVKLFGVRLTDGSIKKSASMGNLSSAHYYSSSSAAASPNPISPSSDPLRDSNPVSQGYDSDDPVHVSSSSNARGDRKKGIPWTEEEHRLFLLGLQKLGKGDWRGIARNFVVSRTPTQVASHAQKYFIRQTNASRRKRRSSLFDMVPDMSMDSSQGPEEQFLLQSSQGGESENIDKLPSLSLSINPESELMGITSNEASIESEANFAPTIPTFFPTYLPITFSLSPSICEKGEMSSQHKVLKPTPILSKEYVNVDEIVGISKLNLCEAVSDCVEPSLLSLKLLGDPSRQSAFHANTSVGEADLRKSDSAIHAV